MRFSVLPLIVYLAVLLGCCLVFCSEQNESTFVPTKEWKVLKKNQAVPKGLHVRLNLETGVREAKLIDDDGMEKSSSVQSNDANNLEDTVDKLKTRLMAIDQDTEGHNDKMDIKRPLRSYQELKEEFKAVDMNITTDSEILTGIFTWFKKHDKALETGSLRRSEADDILHFLNELEYLLHQIDNAQIFADMNGMSKIISPCLNLTNDDVRMEALKVLGTAVQSNPKVQLKALNNDLVQKLLHILTVTNKNSLQSRCMFALGALVRQFPVAQKALVDHGGLEIFGKILENGHLSIQLRVMKLITDLAVEREYIKETDDPILQQMKVREYEKTDFEKKLLLHNYCTDVANLLTKTFGQEITTDLIMQSHEFVEVILENMVTLSSICKQQYRDQGTRLLKVINEMSNLYKNIDSQTSVDDVEILENLASQILKLRTAVFDDSHDEL